MGPELDLRPQLERLDRLICWSEDIDERALTFAFRPLWQLDEPAKAALALSKAQATQVYAGLKLWPDAVMAKLAEAQLVADGAYPNAAAVFAEVGTTDPIGASPTLDYDPAQPRAPDGTWTSGPGSPVAPLAPGTASGEPTPGASPRGDPTTARPDRPADVPHGWREAVAAVANMLDPVGTASAHEAAAPAEALQRACPVPPPEPDPAAEFLARTLAPLYAALQLRQSAIQAVKGFVSRVPEWFSGGSHPEAAPSTEPAEGGRPERFPDPSPPPLTIHGEEGSAALPGFSPALPLPGLPPSVAVPSAGQSNVPGASAPAANNPNSFSQQAEDPEEKAQQEKFREEIENDFDNIKQHITDKDLFGAWAEFNEKKKWTKRDGTAYDHKSEVKDAQNGLRTIALRVKGLLGRRRLLQSEAGPLQDLLGRVSRALDRTEDYYVPPPEKKTEDGWVSVSPQAYDPIAFSR